MPDNLCTMSRPLPLLDCRLCLLLLDWLAAQRWQLKTNSEPAQVQTNQQRTQINNQFK
jgi:hypothetical protein